MTGSGHAGLAGRRIGVTRPALDRAADLLAAAGADVVHVPLIAVGPPPDTAALDAALAALGGADWLVVTSPNGARAVAPAAAAHRHVSVAAVGAATSAALREYAGRPADLVPAVATGAGLVADFPAGSGSVLVAKGNLAPDTVIDGLRAKGWQVESVVAYVTEPVAPPTDQLERLWSCDVVVLASGSAAESLVAAAGPAGLAAIPPVVVVGPSTRHVAERAGLAVAAECPTTRPDDVAATVRALLGGPAG